MPDGDQDVRRSIADGAGLLRLAARRWLVDHTPIVASRAPGAIRPDYGFDAAGSPPIFVVRWLGAVGCGPKAGCQVTRPQSLSPLMDPTSSDGSTHIPG
jgi:hypothetical protein